MKENDLVKKFIKGEFTTPSQFNRVYLQKYKDEFIAKSFKYLKIIKKYREDPCHYLFKENLKKLVKILKKLNLNYDYRLSKGILNSFERDFIIPINFNKNMNIIIKHLKQNRGEEIGEKKN